LSNSYVDASEDSESGIVQYSAEGLDGTAQITYTNITQGMHFITIKYYKDSDTNNGNDIFEITSMVAKP
jgi:hypothetical protein